MLWKQLNPRYRKLLKEGQQGKAVVVAAKTERAGGEAGHGGLVGWKVTIRAKVADGEVRDFKRFIEATAVDVFDVRPGDAVPIRFDPNNPSRVEIDTAALRAHRDRSRSQRHASEDAAVRQAEAQLGITSAEATPTAPGEPSGD